MAEQFVEFMVMNVKDGKYEGMGRQKFRVVPRTGDYITVDENGIGQAYLVKAVLHPMEPAGTAGDLILTHAGTDLELRKSLK